MTTVETAHFRSDDVDVLVAASLACPACLSSHVEFSLGAERFDPSVVVACESCGYERRVFLGPMQELRLSLQHGRPLDRTMRAGSWPGPRL